MYRWLGSDHRRRTLGAAGFLCSQGGHSATSRKDQCHRRPAPGTSRSRCARSPGRTSCPSGSSGNPSKAVHPTPRWHRACGPAAPQSLRGRCTRAECHRRPAPGTSRSRCARSPGRTSCPSGSSGNPSKAVHPTPRWHRACGPAAPQSLRGRCTRAGPEHFHRDVQQLRGAAPHTA